MRKNGKRYRVEVRLYEGDPHQMVTSKPPRAEEGWLTLLSIDGVRRVYAMSRVAQVEWEPLPKEAG